ncbi:MAG: hypothetical protein U0Y68_20810 [Blastocatellia bacterium]
MMPPFFFPMARNNELDNHKWNRNIPPPMDRRKANWFQREIDRIVGVEANGLKRFKLVWLPHYEVWDPYRGEYRLLYTWGKPEIDYKAGPDGIIRQQLKRIGVPRYALFGWTGQFTPKSLQKAGQESDGVEIEELPDGVEVDGLPFIIHEKTINYHATPDVPIYRLELIFAAHERKPDPEMPFPPCCMRRIMSNDAPFDRCFGQYVEPDEEDLNVIRREMRAYETALRQAPRVERSGQSQYAWIQRTEAETKQKEREKLEEAKDYLKKHDGPALHRAMEHAISGQRLMSLPSLPPSQ